VVACQTVLPAHRSPHIIRNRPPRQENVARLNRHHLALFNTEQTHLWLAFWWVGRPTLGERGEAFLC
jgi:hypothetical protein